MLIMTGICVCQVVKVDLWLFYGICLAVQLFLVLVVGDGACLT